MDIKFCDKDGCSRKHYGKGLCNMHYMRKRLGIPNVTKYSPRKATIRGAVAKLPLGMGAKDGYALVDKSFAWLDKYKWCLDSSSYPMCGPIGRLHKIIIQNTDSSKVIDHIDRDKKNNLTSNLRVVTYSENIRNSKLSKVNKSGHKLVHYRKDTNKWCVQLTIDKKRSTVGSFKDLRTALIARDKALSGVKV